MLTFDEIINEPRTRALAPMRAEFAEPLVSILRNGFTDTALLELIKNTAAVLWPHLNDGVIVAEDWAPAYTKDEAYEIGALLFLDNMFPPETQEIADYLCSLIATYNNRFGEQ